jgi:hypothetical protein
MRGGRGGERSVFQGLMITSLRGGKKDRFFLEYKIKKEEKNMHTPVFVLII